MKIPKHTRNYWLEVARVLNGKFCNSQKLERLCHKFYLMTRNSCDSMRPYAELKYQAMVSMDNVPSNRLGYAGLNYDDFEIIEQDDAWFAIQ